MKDLKLIATEVASERATDRHRAFSNLSLVSTKHKYVYMVTPKVANTTVKMALNQLEGNIDPKDLADIHKQGPHLSDFSVEENVEMFTSPEWFRFTFVRNPYDRLLSSYKSKIGTWGHEHQYGWLKDRILSAYNYPTHPKGWVPVVAFRDFVHYLIEHWEHPEIGGDGHLNSQTNILMPHLINYDFVGRFGKFTAHFQEVLTRLGAPQEIKDRAATIYNPTVPIHHAIAYDRELANSVYDLYQQDFEAFGFEKDSWMYDADSPYVRDWQQPR